MMKAAVALLLARPFGTRNLMQRFAENTTEIHKTRNLLDDAREKIPSDMAVKIARWIARFYDCIPFFFEGLEIAGKRISDPLELAYIVICDPGVEPVFPQSYIRGLDNQVLSALSTVIVLEARLYDKVTTLSFTVTHL